MTAKCTDKPAEKREERFNAANYLTDGEILIEIADISERLTDEGVYLTDAQRQEADERRTALAKERAGRRRARSTRRDPLVS